MDSQSVKRFIYRERSFLLLSKTGRKLYKRLLLLCLQLRAQEPANNPPVYNSSWWLNTFEFLTDQQMLALYRMKRETFDSFYDRLRPLLPTEKNGECHLRQVASVLHYFADPVSFRRQGHLHGVAKSTLWEWVGKVSRWINEALISEISFPTAQDGRVVAIAERVYDSTGFPNAVGFVDSSLIRLDYRPSDPDLENSDIFWSRKGFPCFHLQAVCDDQCLFTDVWIGNAGRMNDARVWAGSELAKQLPLLLNAAYHILGDKAYPLSVNLIPPYKGNVVGQELEFNSIHCKARQVIERSFGFLKSRWRILRSMPLKMDRWSEVTMACCILHNICCKSSEAIEWEADPELDAGGQDYPNVAAPVDPAQDIVRAIQKREGIKHRIAYQ